MAEITLRFSLFNDSFMFDSFCAALFPQLARDRSWSAGRVVFFIDEKTGVNIGLFDLADTLIAQISISGKVVYKYEKDRT